MQQGRPDEARALIQLVVAGQEAAIGPDGTDTLDAYFNLAKVEALDAASSTASGNSDSTAALDALCRAVGSPEFQPLAWSDDAFKTLREERPDEFLAVVGPP